MKFSNISRSLGIDLLRFVRDSEPTETEMLDWLGIAQQGRYYVLCKAGLLLLQESKVILSPQHLSPDGKSFRWEHMLYSIDEETIYIFRTEEPELADASDSVAS